MSSKTVWDMPLSELERRKTSFLNWMNESDIAVAVISDAANLAYLTGIDIGGRARGKALVLAADGRHFYVTRSLERHWQDHWRTRSWCQAWAFHEDTETLGDAVARLSRTLAKGSKGKIAVDIAGPAQALNFEAIAQLFEIFGGTMDASPGLGKLRSIKSESELAALRRSGQISMIGAEAAASAISQGASGAEATAAAFGAMVVCDGAQSPVSGPHVTSGVRTAMAHCTWDHAVPAEGDCVVFVLTGTCQRYSAPIEWTVTRGTASPERERILGACMQASDAVMANLKPGMTSHEGDLLCREVFEETGLSEFFFNRAAYGIGLTFGSWMESLVQLKPGDDTVIEPGMVMHLVPALHVPGHGFMIRTTAFEVTETGCVSIRPAPTFGDTI